MTRTFSVKTKEGKYLFTSVYAKTESQMQFAIAEIRKYAANIPLYQLLASGDYYAFLSDAKEAA